MYTAFRILAGAVLLGVGLLLLRRSGHSTRRHRTILFLLAAFLVGVLYLIPVENLFVTFASPEEAYRYANTGTAGTVMEGKTTCFVVASDGKTESCLIIPRAGHGWKIGRGVDTRCVNRQISDVASVQVYQYKDTDDFYVVISGIQAGELEVSDNRGSAFFATRNFVQALDAEYYTYYAYVFGLDQTYQLRIGKETIDVESGSIRMELHTDAFFPDAFAMQKHSKTLCAEVFACSRGVLRRST